MSRREGWGSPSAGAAFRVRLVPGPPSPADPPRSARYPAAVKPRRVPSLYSTERRNLCPRCAWPVRDCRCDLRPEERVPERVVARLRIEKAGRRGKTVTVVEGLARNQTFLKELLSELKRALGTGGAALEDRLELQGDHREALRTLLSAKGWTVKG